MMCNIKVELNDIVPSNNSDFLEFSFGKNIPVWTTNFRGNPNSSWKDGRFKVLPEVHAKDEMHSNTYFSLSTFNLSDQEYRARRNDLFDALHVVVIDDVGTKGQSLEIIKNILEPTYVLETSKNNYQVGYVLSEPCADISKASSVINCINHEQGDKGAKGVNRVMRLPYGINCKPENNGFEVKIKEWSGCKYVIDKIIKSFNINVSQYDYKKLDRAGRGNENIKDEDLNTPWSIEDITVMLSFLDPDLLEYDIWLSILMAVHSEYSTSIGLAVVDEWCRRGKRYENNEVFKRWNGFNEIGGLTGRKSIGTLIYFAKKSGWKPNDIQNTKSMIDELVSQFVWCIGQEKFIDTHKNDIFLTPTGLRRTMMNRIEKADDRILLHKNHIQVLNPAFVPAKGTIVNIDGYAYYNRWKSSGVIPVEGNVTPFYEIMEHVYPDSEIRKTMIWFMAHTVVMPEIKIRWVPLIISRNEGIGKTLVFEKLLASLVGQQFSRSVGEDELFGSFNGYASSTKLMMIEEIWIPGLEGKKLVNKLKPIQSNDYIRVNEKNLKPYDIRNYINMVIFSNHIDAAAISKHSRRYFVYSSPALTMDKVKDGWGNEFKVWLNSGGLGKVLWHFQNEVDLDAFEAAGNAPHTDDKELVASMAEDDFTALLKDSFIMGREPFESGNGFVSLEDVRALWRTNGFGNRTTGYFDSIMRDMGWVYVSGAMKFVDKQSRRWPAGWCATSEIELLKPADQYVLLKMQSKGEIDLTKPLESQPDRIKVFFSHLPHIK